MEKWKETQRFADKAILLIVAIPILLSFFIAYYYQSTTSFLIVLGGMAFTAILIGVLKLDVRINEEGIHFKYFPFHTTERLIPWKEVKEWKLLKVDAIKDFGGIGIRYSLKKKGFIINSKFGLEVKKTDNRILVISITNGAKAEEALQYFQPKRT